MFPVALRVRNGLPVWKPSAQITQRKHYGNISAERTPVLLKLQSRSSINLLIDIQNCIKTQESKGYEQWAKIYNLKQAAKTLNFLTEHKIEQYTDLTTKISEIAVASEQTVGNLKAAEKRLADMAVLIKNVTTYQKTKPAYDAYHKAKNKGRYRADHERAINLHEAMAKALQTAVIKKLPNLTSLQVEYEQFQAQKGTLYVDYRNQKSKTRNMILSGTTLTAFCSRINPYKKK